VELRRRRYARGQGGGADAPVDDLIDLASSGVSLAVREMCCRIATDSASFLRAAANLARVGQLHLSDETLRQVVEAEGRAVLAWQGQEQLEFDFDAQKCLTTETPDGSAVSRVYVGIDGFMLPMVSDAEAGKRHEKRVARRKTLKRRRGVRRAKLVRRAGADQRYKEFKLVTLYDQEQTHRRVRVTRSGRGRAGQLLREMAQDVKLRRARQVVAVTDGAEWIAGLIDRDLPPEKTTAILDFYHASQHVHQARRIVFGETGEAGNHWAGELLHLLAGASFEQWWQKLLETRATVRSPAKRGALDDLMRYLLQRREKVDYAGFRQAGFSIGSGPTESMCKSLGRRMKGVGMRWTAKNAEAMVALESLQQSNQWPAYWTTRLAA
jgi:hypothetical protein